MYTGRIRNIFSFIPSMEVYSTLYDDTDSLFNFDLPFDLEILQIGKYFGRSIS